MKPFEQVVRDHGATVLRVCRGVVGPDDAEDAWSETFLAALRAYPDLAPGANLEAWLVTIAHRKAIDLLRARGRRPVPTDRLPERIVDAPTGPDDDLRTALEALTVRQREAVVYHHVAGLPYQEIAGVVGGTPEAARRAAADGIALLRRLLAPSASGAAGPAVPVLTHPRALGGTR